MKNIKKIACYAVAFIIYFAILGNYGWREMVAGIFIGVATNLVNIIFDDKLKI